MHNSFVVSVVSGTFQSKAVWQFLEMIECVQPDVSALQYNEYGCWCGFGGSGTPVDDVDRCAHVCEGRRGSPKGTPPQDVVLQVLQSSWQVLRGEQEAARMHSRGWPSLHHRLWVHLLKPTGDLLRWGTAPQAQCVIHSCRYCSNATVIPWVGRNTHHKILKAHKWAQRSHFVLTRLSSQRSTISVKPPSASATEWHRTASLGTPTTPRTRTWIPKSTVWTEHRTCPPKQEWKPFLLD